MSTEDTKISYKGLTAAEALVALYHGTHPLGLGALRNMPSFGVKDAQDEIDFMTAGGASPAVYFDYVAGRPLKVRLLLDEEAIENPRLYERDAGRGACLAVINRAINQKASKPVI